MPSRRRTRRAPRPVRRRRLRGRSARSRKKLRKPQKPRLVRRYIKGKQRPNPKHTAESSNTKHPSVQLVKGNKSLAQNSDAKPPGANVHNAIPNGGDKKNATSPAAAPAPAPNPEPVEGMAVPNPTPDNGHPAMDPPQITGSPLLGDVVFTTASAQDILTGQPAVPLTFSPLPPLSSLLYSKTAVISTPSLILGHSSLLLPVETGLPTNTSATDVQTSAPSKGHPVNLAVIVLLAVGSGLLALGLCILAKMCTRPRRKDRPKPSLPIFKDVDPEEDFYETESKKDSPLFGGKERFSPMPGTFGVPLWNWVPYPHQRLTQPPTQSTAQNNTGYNYSNVAPASNATTPAQPTTQYTTQTDVGVSQPNPLPMTTAVSHRSVKRQSTASLSPYSPRLYANIGQAITHDNQPMSSSEDQEDPKPVKSKSAKRRSQIAREEKEKAKQRDSTFSDVGLAYDGTDIGSPGALEYLPADKTPGTSGHEGRERIRSGYFAAGTYPRISTMPGTSYSIATATRVNVGQRNSFSRDKFASPPLQRSNSKRQRDTQALTYALGLATPETKYMAQSSPQPTIYPDDSMSVVETKRPIGKKRKPVDRESIPDVPVVVPDEPSSRTRRSSGLMGMDFGLSQMSFSGLTMDDRAEEGGSSSNSASNSTGALGSSASGTGSGSGDRPPRVPSPPPLPSLAQMALAQHNPEAYANYRSPTYSLYNLYEDRKSVVR